MNNSSVSSTICRTCIAAAGLALDRCQRCQDFGLFQSGRYSISDLDGLTARGRLAFVLAALAALEKQLGEPDAD